LSKMCKGNCQISILRLDSGYMSSDTLDYVIEQSLHLCMANWLLACGLDEGKWERLDEKTRLYDKLFLQVNITFAPY